MLESALSYVYVVMAMMLPTSASAPAEQRAYLGCTLVYGVLATNDYIALEPEDQDEWEPYIERIDEACETYRPEGADRVVGNPVDVVVR